MSLKSIEKNYTNFLQMFKDMGVTLTESQKETLDTFMLDLENTIDKTRDDAIRATKKIVEEKLEKEYQTVIGSIFENQKKIDSLKEMIKDKINESKSEPLINKLDEFLDEHLESVISKKQIVDYTRLQKLEQIQESMKDMLIGKTIDEGTEEMKNKISKLQKDLNESIQSNVKLMKQIEKNSKVIGESEEKDDEVKTDAPAPESTEDTTSSAEEKEEKETADDGVEKNLEEAIKDILENNEKKDETPSSETTDNTENNSTEANVEGTEPEAKEDVDAENVEEDDLEIFQESMISWLGNLEKQQYTKL